jgi:endonuclease YncB( thermonuclease family)
VVTRPSAEQIRREAEARAAAERRREEERARAAQARAEAVARSEAARAATLLKSGLALENDGKIDGALSTYRKVLTTYPGTEQAGSAAERQEKVGRACEVVSVEDDLVVILRVGDREVPARLAGVELAGGSQAAARASLSSLLSGRAVHVDHDPGRDGKDGEGRYLVYLFRSPDGRFINQAVITEGHARPATLPSYRARFPLTARE